jgi:solute carrier family 35 protein C2
MFYQDYVFSRFTVAMRSIGVIALPGVLAFAMVASEFFVIQRAGVVPLSIAGIAKEVSTLAFSAWVFGDKLTTLNIIGCAVTILGIALYSFHKYTKSMRKDIKLDATDNPIDAEDDETAPLNARHSRTHSRALSTASTHSFARSTRSARSGRSGHTVHGSLTSPLAGGVPLQDLDGSSGRAISVEDAHEERVTRLRDEFEGWDTVDVDSEEESEADDDEVALRRGEKVGGMRNRWNRFWDASM